jgi:hypothetical protein
MYSLFQFIIESVPVEKEGDLPVLFEPFLTTVRQIRYTFIRDLYVWNYPLSYEDICNFVSENDVKFFGIRRWVDLFGSISLSRLVKMLKHFN